MRENYIKPIIILAVIIVVSSLLARTMSGGETLSDYAKNSPNNSSSAINNTADSYKDVSSSDQKINIPDSSMQISSEIKEDRVVLDEGFYYDPIDEVYDKVRDDQTNLVCCTVKYISFDGTELSGQIICDLSIGDDILKIFKELYINDYRIEYIDSCFNASANKDSSVDNNTICYLDKDYDSEKHASGLAIDINPLYNPYISYDESGNTIVEPSSSGEYIDRTNNFPYKIDENDLAYKLFTLHGFTWGGNWNSGKSYGHFQK